jgi:DNA-binding LacI/PurR family transcriptional regulator
MAAMSDTARNRLPFRVERAAGSTLIEQVAAGVRQAILTGRYRAGETLPTKLQMAAELGVSEIVIRRAMARLRHEGLVAPKRRQGVLVCDPGRHAWMGHVLLATWPGATMYYHAVSTAEITHRLHARRYLVTDLHLDHVQRKRHYPELRSILATRSVTLVLVEGGGGVTVPASARQRLPRLLREADVPFVHVDEYPSYLYSEAAAGIAFSRDAAYGALAAHCRACGIRTARLMVTQVSPDAPHHALLCRLLAAAGVRCEWWEVPPLPGMAAPESVERAGLEAVAAWLAQRPALPDLLYFGDDFLARGALLALAQRGLRVPEDVQVATWANRGLGPVFSRPLTRIEMDPVQHGHAIAECVLRVLAGRKPRTVPVLEPAFVAGATTRANPSQIISEDGNRVPSGESAWASS